MNSLLSRDYIIMCGGLLSIPVIVILIFLIFVEVTDKKRPIEKLKAKRDVRGLIKALNNRNADVRGAAAEALELLGWRPQNVAQRRLYAVARGTWSEAADLGGLAKVHIACDPRLNFIAKVLPSKILSAREDADYIVYIYEERIQVGTYSNNFTKAVRVNTTVRVMARSNLRIIAQKLFVGGDPPAKTMVTASEETGSVPYDEIRNYLKVLLKDRFVILINFNELNAVAEL